MQSWKKSGLAALLLIILLAGVLFASEPEEEVLLELPEQRAETEEKRPAHQSIAGSEQAAVSKGLKDPFTLLHETREEKGKAAEKKTAVQAAEQEKRPAPPISPKAAMPPKPPAVQEPKLTGIISGAAGHLALIDYGEKSLTLSAGEGAEGIIVTAIEPRRVCVSTPQGEKWLELP